MKFTVTSARIPMFDSTDANALPAATTKAAGYVNGRADWQSYEPIRRRFPNARVFGIDVFGNGWGWASITDYEQGNGTYKKPDVLRSFVQNRNGFRPETACVYCDRADLGDVEDYLQGIWHVLWIANWGPNGTIGESLTGTRTEAGNLIVATQLVNVEAANYDMSDSLESW